MAITKKQSWWIGIVLSTIWTSYCSYQFYIDYDRITTSIPTIPSTLAATITIGVILFMSVGILVLPRMMIEEGLEENVEA